MSNDDRSGEKGLALLAAVILAAFLMVVLGAYFLVTGNERGAARSSMESTRGFYAAEAGLNLRYQQIRETFHGYNLPSGTTPVAYPGQLPCQGGDQGTGDFSCDSIDLGERNVLTYVSAEPTNPREIVIPRGEPYQNLRAQEYAYTVRSVSTEDDERPEAIVDMHLASRLVPLFQFAVFYNKDLEIQPGPAMNFAGPVHSNGDLYLGAGTSLTINGQVSTAGNLYNGRKDVNSGGSSNIRVYDPSSPTALPSAANRLKIEESDVAAWNGMIRMGTDFADVPAPEALDPVPGSTYWDRADLRIVLNVNAGMPPPVEVRDPAGNVNATATALLTGCPGAVGTSNSLNNFREGTTIRMLEIDMLQMLDCIAADPAIQGGRGVDDATEGGLVWHLSVDGPDSGAVNNYGVRVKNAASLAAPDNDVDGAGNPLPPPPPIKGLTVVTDQALYVQGNYNSVGKKPAAFLADSLNVLSNNWSDANSGSALGSRTATATTINAAFLAGTDVTGGVEGAPQDTGNYNGGLENYPRFHENWSGVSLNYSGSFISLNVPRHVDGAWGAQSYNAPNRNWSYDTDFNQAENLPPLSPRFVYIRQDLFVRNFDY